MKSSRLLQVALVSLVLSGLSSAARAGDWCPFRGSFFLDGGKVCQDGTVYRCDNGEWEALKEACTSATTLGAADPCQLNGITYSTGLASCQAGIQSRCDNGVWKATGLNCSVGDAPIRAVRGSRTCRFVESQIQSNTAVCKSGTTYVCSDGAWLNVGTLCRG